MVCYYWCSILNENDENSLLSICFLLNPNVPGLGRRCRSVPGRAGRLSRGTPLHASHLRQRAGVHRLHAGRLQEPPAAYQVLAARGIPLRAAARGISSVLDDAVSQRGNYFLLI